MYISNIDSKQMDFDWGPLCGKLHNLCDLPHTAQGKEALIPLGF